MRSLTFLFLVFVVSSTLFGQPGKSRSSGDSVRPKATAKPSPTPRRKPTQSSAKKPGEKSEWERVTKLTDPAERIAALKKFNSMFPASPQRAEALALLASSRGELGNAKLAAADVSAAAVIFKEAAADVPKPITDTLWTDIFAKVPLNLYFRGSRNEAYEVARILEEKTDGNSSQSLALANFYLTVEDGSSARKLAERVIAAEPGSAAAYLTLGLAYRVDFQLDESAAAYYKAVELDPQSVPAKRGLAEAKRSLGKSEEALSLYREILEKEPENIPAHTGLTLALFDAGKRSDAENELTKALAANEGNVILLAGAAYWYAAHSEGNKAIEYAQKAIAADPRYIWSHIALARGLQLQNRFADAEKALFNAQRYGNFPTMQYELASARLSAGYYRDALDEISKSFSITDGSITLKLGGRITREGTDISELIGYERRASTFSPAAADNADIAAKIVALLEFGERINSAEVKPDMVAAAAEKFVAGDDKMRVFRQLFAAKLLLGKNVALDKVIELAKGAGPLVDKGLDAPSAATALMAGEIYDVRADSARRGEYVNVPEIPRNVISSVLRGDIEAILGWANFLQNNSDEAVVHLRRSVAVLPVDSAWWRSTMWKLGSALSAAGKDSEALETYIKVYRSAGVPDRIHYAMIEPLYKRLNGNVEGLESRLGAGTVPVVEAAPTPTPEPSASAPTPDIKASPTPSGSTAEEKVKEPLPPLFQACVLTASEDSAAVSASGTPLSIMISSEADISLDDLSGLSSSPGDLSVTREIIAGVNSRAIFVLRSASGKPGTYRVIFQMPCGKKEVTVTVK